MRASDGSGASADRQAGHRREYDHDDGHGQGRTHGIHEHLSKDRVGEALHLGGDVRRKTRRQRHQSTLRRPANLQADAAEVTEAVDEWLPQRRRQLVRRGHRLREEQCGQSILEYGADDRRTKDTSDLAGGVVQPGSTARQ